MSKRYLPEARWEHNHWVPYVYLPAHPDLCLTDWPDGFQASDIPRPRYNTGQRITFRWPVRGGGHRRAWGIIERIYLPGGGSGHGSTSEVSTHYDASKTSYVVGSSGGHDLVVYPADIIEGDT